MADGLSQLPTRPGRGGARRGAGRPRGVTDSHPRFPTEVKQSFAELYRTRIDAEAPAILNAVITSAKGRDSRIIVDLLNRLLGRPALALEISGPGGAPVRLQAMTAVVLAQLSEAEFEVIESLNKRLLGAPGLAGAAPVVDVTEDGEQ